MDGAKHSRERPLTLSPKALDKALATSAERARRLAEAFGQKVPVVRTGTARPAAKKSGKH